MTPVNFLFEPILSIVGIENLDVLEWPEGGSREEVAERPIAWDEINFQVQALLGNLCRSVRRACPEVKERGGKATGRCFYLYSYRSFQLCDDEDVDSLVIGVRFEPSEKGAIVRGEIGGEESGRTDFESSSLETELEFSKAAAAARRIVTELESQTDLIVQRITERHPVPQY